MGIVRIGIIGVGNMGHFHARQILEGKINRCELTAIADCNPDKRALFAENKSVTCFATASELIGSGLVDAVLVATPHFSHTTIGIEALKKGLHVLVEKPISVHKADCERLISAHKNKKQVFAAMFNQRTDPRYAKVRQMIQEGELGKITRVNWIITNWFRTEAYYASGGWRATWEGEGGGVLLNQCPHNLDLMQYLFGMPSRVRANCYLGKYHKIEVEDEVTAFLEYPDGATGIFVTSTGEAPGTNRLEVTGERGKLVVEGNSILFTRNEVEMSRFSKTTKETFAAPPVWNVEIPVKPAPPVQHNVILQNFTDAILDKTPLIAPAEEGIKSVELGNAMLFSSMTGEAVEMPLNGAKFEKMLRKLIEGSTLGKKKTMGKKAAPAGDFSKSFK